MRGGPDLRERLNRAQNAEQVDVKRAGFCGRQDQGAQTLLSESYRNAVAAAVLMAATKRHVAPFQARFAPTLFLGGFHLASLKEDISRIRVAARGIGP